jgi:hypothetical protein
MCEAMLSPEVVEPTLKMMDDGFHFLVEENDDVHMLGNQDVPELMNICTQRTTSDLLMMIEVPDLCEDALSIVSDWTTSSSLEESDENDSGLDIDLESSGFTSAHSFAMTQQQRKQDDTTTTPSVLANDPPSTPPTPVETTDTKKKYTITKTTKSGRTVKSTLKLQQQQQEQTQPKPKTIKVTTTEKSKPAGKKSQNTATTKKTTTTPPSSSNTSKNSKISATRLARLERNKLAARESRRRKKVHVDKLTALIESIEKRCTANDKRIADMLRMKDQLQAKFNAQQQRLIMA